MNPMKPVWVMERSPSFPRNHHWIISTLNTFFLIFNKKLYMYSLCVTVIFRYYVRIMYIVNWAGLMGVILKDDSSWSCHFVSSYIEIDCLFFTWMFAWGTSWRSKCCIITLLGAWKIQCADYFSLSMMKYIQFIFSSTVLCSPPAGSLIN